MPRHLRTGLGLLLATTALQIGIVPTPSSAADEPVRSISVTGVDVSTWPAYDPALQRFAIDTGPGTAGTVTVTASTADPAGTVTVDGAPAGNGVPTEVTGLEPGDEVSVSIQDSAGTSHQSFIYLPAGFPALASSGPRPAGSPPYVFLGLGSFLSETSYETVVDGYGVPLHVREALEPHDFKAQPHGPAYTVFEPVKETPDDQEYGYRLRELDEEFELTGTRRLVPVDGIVEDDTDFHDAEYLPDGRVVLVGYSRDERDGEKWLDAVIEIVDTDGTVDFAWSSKEAVEDPAGEGYAFGLKAYRDYAHINSVEMQPNGDLLASFRNLGQVMRIATTAHDGVAPGDVVWKMGGKENQFTFDDPGYAGFCAQHDARLVGDRLMLFDNGSRFDGANALGGQTANMCPDPADPTGPRVARAQSRVVEYQLDEQTHTATRVWNHAPQGRYAAFAGNAQRLPDDHVLVGWSRADNLAGPAPAPITSEVSAAGDEVWTLTAEGWFSYRAFAYDAPDAIEPEVEVVVERGPGDRATVSYTCTDRGGSNLASCAGERPSGSSITPAQAAEFTVTATDGAGNTGTAAARPGDLEIRKPGRSWRGGDRFDTSRPPRVEHALRRAGATRTALVRLTNRGALPSRFELSGTGGTGKFRIRYLHRGRDITRDLLHGRVSTPRLDPGERWTLTVQLRRTRRAERGDRRLATVRTLAGGGTWTDAVAVLARAR